MRRGHLDFGRAAHEAERDPVIRERLAQSFLKTHISDHFAVVVCVYEYSVANPPGVAVVVNVFADDTKPRLEDELAPADNLTAVSQQSTKEDDAR